MQTVLNNSGILKKTHLSIIAILAFTTMVSCNKDDVTEKEVVIPAEETTIFGIWRADSNVFEYEDSKYIIVNDDYSISVLIEDELGFRHIYNEFEVNANNKISNNSRFFAVEDYEYTLEGNNLSIVNSADGSQVTLIRDNSGPTTNTWVKTLTILNQQDAPWNRNVDIGYNGSMILFPNGAEDQNIALVNPMTLNQDGYLLTDIHSYPVEAEKSTGTDQHYFQVESNSTIINAYLVPGEETNYVFQSQELGDTVDLEFTNDATIRGLAVTGDKTIWASNLFERKLYLYKYDGAGQIIDQISLNILPYGLDFQNGYLYVSDGELLHKCQTSSGFSVVESYKIPGHNIFGIAFDGENFILNTQKSPEDDDALIIVGSETDNKLLKVSL